MNKVDDSGVERMLFRHLPCNHTTGLRRVDRDRSSASQDLIPRDTDIRIDTVG